MYELPGSLLGSRGAAIVDRAERKKERQINEFA